MRTRPVDAGASRVQLLSGAWATGLVTAVCLIRLLFLPARVAPRFQPSDLTWLGVGVVAAIACVGLCVVLSIRGIEARLFEAIDDADRADRADRPR